MKLQNWVFLLLNEFMAIGQKPTVSGWKPALLEHAITPVQQYSYTTGKNATDSAMIIDAMDILHSEKVDGFCLVSSDSDFTRLATRLRESGMLVIGIGEKENTQSLYCSMRQVHLYRNSKTCTSSFRERHSQKSIEERYGFCKSAIKQN